MKTMGLIGGMSWESTLEYYRIINEEMNQRLGGLNSAQCLLYSVNFDELYQCMQSDDWGKITEILTAAGKKLQAGGADFALICTNTMHKVFEEIEGQLGIPMIHIADPAIEAVTATGLKKIGLLGTAFTMEQDFFRSRIRKQGIEVVVPEKDEREFIHRAIFQELCQGIVLDESKRKFIRCIERMAEKGAEGFILGCTELGMIIHKDDIPYPIFDTTVLHAQAAVNQSLE